MVIVVAATVVSVAFTISFSGIVIYMFVVGTVEDGVSVVAVVLVCEVTKTFTIEVVLSVTLLLVIELYGIADCVVDITLDESDNKVILSCAAILWVVSVDIYDASFVLDVAEVSKTVGCVD